MASRPASGSRKRGVKVAKIPSRNSRSPARRLEREHPVDREKRLEELQQQCTEIKCLINSTSEENLRTRTRLMSLEKELNKRERLLQMLVKLSQANLPLGPELVEKLREERNLLPLYRRKAQDLQQLIDEREKDHKAMKRDPFFTRVIELQVEYVSWKQEGLRLEALLSDEDKDAGKKEAEVYQTRVEKLTEEREAKEKQLQKVKQELEEEEAEHATAEELCKEREEELTREQDDTREVAISFKQLLQERKEAEKLQQDVEEMELQRKRDQEELVALQEKAPAAAPGRFTVTGAALSAKAPKDEGLCLLRRALTWEPEPPGRPFFSCLRAADTDQDGLLSRPELRHALSQWSCCPLEPAEAADLLFGLASTSNAEAADQVRWLDVLVLLDGLGGPVDETLPETPPLRWACLRAQLCAEALQQLGHLDLRGAKAFFGGFELAQEHRDAWVEAWQRHGSHRLMLLLPLAEVTLSSSEMSSWLARVKMAVQNNYQELEKSFTVWRADMLLTPEQFRMVCGDVLGLELSEEDIEDLLFLCSPQFPTPGLREVIDGQQLLQNFG